jgi:tRNA modification GTPase
VANDERTIDVENEGVAAISTPAGVGGIAIVRLSGAGVIETADALFSAAAENAGLKTKKSYTLTLGWLNDENGDRIDQVLVSVMRKPHSYTGEDVVEINCHGGLLVAQKCLRQFLKAGLRLAEPGEFTRRAFLNGRLDISQAEAVIEIINARSDKMLQLSVRQLEGINSRLISAVEERLLSLTADIEAALDFPDEAGEISLEAMEETVKIQINELENMLQGAKRTEIYRNGAVITICGKPNVGKSTLLNTFLCKERAIVTPVPGTTRDTIEEFLTIRGIPVKLIDTAGIRETRDLIENLGVERSKKAIYNSDALLFLLDGAGGVEEEDIAVYELIKDFEPLIVINKSDLKEQKASSAELETLFPRQRFLFISAREGYGLEQLEAAIEAKILGGGAETAHYEIMVNIRQKEALLKAIKHLKDFLETCGIITLDCLSIDIEMAGYALGEITGKNLKEEAIDRIFSEFCIGK